MELAQQDRALPADGELRGLPPERTGLQMTEPQPRPSLANRLVGQLPKLWGNWISLTGTTFATFAGNAFLIMMVVDIVSSGANRYVATFGYLLMPPVFILGLVLVALGVWRDHRRVVRGKQAPGGVIDSALNMVLQDRLGRRRMFFVLGATLVNITIVSVAAYQAIKYLDSPRFCGQACHTAMRPEYTAYLRSPHARVICVDCHIGEGAKSMVQAKLSGLRQVWAVLRNSYQRPIPTPIHNLRPARETCEKCHWPEKFHGERTLVRHVYKEDQKNTRTSNVVRVKVGGRNRRSGKFEGLHWHVGDENVIEYEALDEKRARIGSIKLTSGGKTLVFKSPDQKPGDKVFERRAMDCVDCHNRPTHIYDPTPEHAVDSALAYGKLDPALPFIKREGVKLLKLEIADTEQAAARFASSLKGFYAKSFPDVARSKAAAIEKAGRELGWIYGRNVFPPSRVGWNTYPSHLGHRRTTEGCFRCHDDKHKAADGKVVRQDCDLCHEVLADGDEQPNVPKDVLQLGNM
jgi:hypothetical protein